MASTQLAVAAAQLHNDGPSVELHPADENATQHTSHSHPHPHPHPHPHHLILQPRSLLHVTPQFFMPASFSTIASNNSGSSNSGVSAAFIRLQTLLRRDKEEWSLYDIERACDVFALDDDPSIYFSPPSSPSNHNSRDASDATGHTIAVFGQPHHQGSGDSAAKSSILPFETSDSNRPSKETQSERERPAGNVNAKQPAPTNLSQHRQKKPNETARPPSILSSSASRSGGDASASASTEKPTKRMTVSFSDNEASSMSRATSNGTTTTTTTATNVKPNGRISSSTSSRGSSSSCGSYGSYSSQCSSGSYDIDNSSSSQKNGNLKGDTRANKTSHAVSASSSSQKDGDSSRRNGQNHENFVCKKEGKTASKASDDSNDTHKDPSVLNQTPGQLQIAQQPRRPWIVHERYAFLQAIVQNSDLAQLTYLATILEPVHHHDFEAHLKVTYAGGLQSPRRERPSLLRRTRPITGGSKVIDDRNPTGASIAGNNTPATVSDDIEISRLISRMNMPTFQIGGPVLPRQPPSFIRQASDFEDKQTKNLLSLSPHVAATTATMGIDASSVTPSQSPDRMSRIIPLDHTDRSSIPIDQDTFPQPKQRSESPQRIANNKEGNPQRVAERGGDFGHISRHQNSSPGKSLPDQDRHRQRPHHLNQNEFGTTQSPSTGLRLEGTSSSLPKREQGASRVRAEVEHGTYASYKENENHQFPHAAKSRTIVSDSSHSSSRSTQPSSNHQATMTASSAPMVKSSTPPSNIANSTATAMVTTTSTMTRASHQAHLQSRMMNYPHPSPGVHWLRNPVEHLTHLKPLLHQYMRASATDRIRILTVLLRRCTPPALASLARAHTRRMYRDFLTLLPENVAMLLMSKLDPVTITRVAQVSKKWASYAKNNNLWRLKCWERGWVLSASGADERPASAGEEEEMAHTEETRAAAAAAKLSKRDIDYQKLFKERLLIERSLVRGQYRLQVLQGHSNRVLCFRVLLKKGVIISGSVDRTWRMWSLNTGKCIFRGTGHAGGVWCIAADDANIFTGSWDTTIKTWDFDTGTCIATLEGHRDTVSSLSCDQQRVFSGSYDTTLRIWSRESCRCVRILRGHSGPVYTLQLHDHGRILSGSGDKTIRLWDSLTGACLRVLPGHGHAVMSLMAEGHRLVTAHYNLLTIWDMNTWKAVANLEGHTGRIESVHLSGSRLVSASRDHTIMEWNIHTGEVVQVLKGHGAPVTSVFFTDKMIVSGSDDMTIRIFNFIG